MSSVPYFGRDTKRLQQAVKWPYYLAIGKRLGLTDIDPKHCALLVVDINHNMALDTGGIMAIYNKELGELLSKRWREIALPNLLKLIEFFRGKDMPVIFLILGRSAAVHPQLSPREDEWIITKYVSGAFGNTILDKILKDNEIDTVFITGFDTAGCVSLTGFGALDHGYRVILVEDASLSNRPDTHEAAVRIWSLMGYVQTADRVVADYPWQSWIDIEPPPPPPEDKKQILMDLLARHHYSRKGASPNFG